MRRNLVILIGSLAVGLGSGWALHLWVHRHCPPQPVTSTNVADLLADRGFLVVQVDEHGALCRVYVGSKSWTARAATPEEAQTAALAAWRTGR
jgi:hypothetical protein